MPIRSADENVEKYIDTVEAAIKSGMKDPTHYIKMGTVGFVVSKNIQGYYTRPVIETAQERVLKKIEKTMSEVDNGDSWKDS